MDNYNAKNVLNTKELKEAITIIEHIRKEQQIIELQDLCTKASNLINKSISHIRNHKVENEEYWKDKVPLCKQIQ